MSCPSKVLFVKQLQEAGNPEGYMIDLTKVPEETRYIRNREVAENGYDMQETANLTLN